MNQSDKSHILMLCGALHDISENIKEYIPAFQIDDVRVKIERIVRKNLSKKLKKELDL